MKIAVILMAKRQLKCAVCEELIAKGETYVDCEDRFYHSKCHETVPVTVSKQKDSNETNEEN